MNELDEHFFDRIKVTDEKAKRALAYVKEHLGGPHDIVFVRNMALLNEHTCSPVLRDLTIGLAEQLQFTLMDLAARCSHRARVVRRTSRAQHENRLLESANLCSSLMRQVIKCGRIMLEADAPLKGKRRRRG